MTAPRGESWMRRLLPRDDENGVALVTVMLVLMVLTALGATVALVSINNVNNARRDREAGTSLGAGDAGVAMAVEYIRNNGVGSLKCPESNPSSCSSNPAGYNNPTNPKQISLDSSGLGCSSGKNCAKVWIGVVQAFSPPTYKYGIYNIHSEGIYGNGPSARQIVSTVKVTTDKFPIGVFGQEVDGNGGNQVSTESLFTTKCVYPRWTGSGNGLRFTGVDAYWGQPAAAHTTDHVSSSNNCSSSGYIESAAPSAGTASDNHCPNNSAINADQSGDGGLVASGVGTGAACYHQYQRPDGSWYPDGTCPAGVTPTRSDGLCDTTSFTTTDLQRYGYRPRGLSDAQYSALKARSQSQGLYNLTTNIATALTNAVASGINDPVLYWDCSVAAANCSSGVTLHVATDIPSNLFTDDATTCSNPYQIVTIVVENGDLTFQGGNARSVDAAIFVPDGGFNGNGGYNIVGTLFAQNLSLGGNQNWSLSSCWVANFPGAISTVVQTAFREDDSKDLS